MYGCKGGRVRHEWLPHLPSPHPPPPLPPPRAQEVAMRAVASLEGAGVFGVEMFWLSDGTVLLNEVAPRPHNSGHYTIEACRTSQVMD